MQKMSPLKTACICAICIALCYVMPIAFHSVGLGSVFAPMHIPVLLCGLICGSFYGAFCGIIGPILSSILTGMPGPTVLVSMIPELAVYGLVAGLLMKCIRTGKLYLDLYLVLIPTLIAGRIVGGIAEALFIRLMSTGKVFTLSVWVTGYFVTKLPGIAIHLMAIPLLVTMLMKARLIPDRYSGCTESVRMEEIPCKSAM